MKVVDAGLIVELLVGNLDPDQLGDDELAAPHLLDSEVTKILFFAVQTNFVLFFFNLIPLPPLDGGHVAQSFVPYRQREAFDHFARFAPFVLLAIMMIPQIGWVFRWPADYLTVHLYQLLTRLFALRLH